MAVEVVWECVAVEVVGVCWGVWRSRWLVCGGLVVGVSVFNGFAMRVVISSITVICEI